MIDILKEFKRGLASVLALSLLASSFLNAGSAFAEFEYRDAPVKTEASRIGARRYHEAGHRIHAASWTKEEPAQLAGPKTEAAGAGPVLLPKSSVVANQASQPAPSSGASLAGAFRGVFHGTGRVIARLLGTAPGKISFDGSVGRASLAPSYGLGVHKPRDAKPNIPEELKLDLTPSRRAAGAAPAAPGAPAEPAKITGIPLNVAITNDPTKDGPAVEAALRAMMDSQPERLNVTSSGRHGPLSSQMQKVHIEYRPAKKAGQSDGYSFVTRRWITGARQDGKSKYYLEVDNAYSTMHVRVVGGKAVLYLLPGDIRPNFAVDIDPSVMNEKFTQTELEALALKRLRSPPDAPAGGSSAQAGPPKNPAGTPTGSVPQKVVFLTRTLTNIENAWHAVNIYEALDLDGNPTLIVAVDVNTGKAWLFNAQEFRSGAFIPRRAAAKRTWRHALAAGLLGLRAGIASFGQTAGAPPQGGQPQNGQDAGRGIQVFGRGSTMTPDNLDGGPIAPMPLPRAKVFGPAGTILAWTDDEGYFTLPASLGPGPITATIRLDGADGKVTDADPNSPALEVAMQVIPGQTAAASKTINPTSSLEGLAARVTLFAAAAWHTAWARDFLGLTDKRLFTEMKGGMRANDPSMDGNAAYMPQIDGFATAPMAPLPQQAPGQNAGVNSGILKSILLRALDAAIGAVQRYFENTAKFSIILHEKTHRWNQVISQVPLTPEQENDQAYEYVKWSMDAIVDGASNEGHSDSVSDAMRRNGVIGNNFITPAIPGKPNWIRNASDTTVYDPTSRDQQVDPHALGEIQAEISYQSLQELSKPESLGPVAGPKFHADTFVTDLLFLQPSSVVNAVMHAVLSTLNADGSVSPEGLMIYQRATNDHKLPLPALPAAPAASGVSPGGTAPSATANGGIEFVGEFHGRAAVWSKVVELYRAGEATHIAVVKSKDDPCGLSPGGCVVAAGEANPIDVTMGIFSYKIAPTENDPHRQLNRVAKTELVKLYVKKIGRSRVAMVVPE